MMSNITTYTCSKPQNTSVSEETIRGRYIWESDPSWSQADYLRHVEIRARGLANSAECQEAQPSFFTIPKVFPQRWSYSTTYVPVSNELLFDSPFQGLIPTLQGAQAKALADDRAESDRRHFWNMLVATLPQLATFPPIITHRSSKKIKILDVGCGDGWDAMPLVSYFGGSNFNHLNSNVDYLGIDISQGAIEDARKFHQEKGWPNLRFENADATCLNEHLFTRDKFDIIVIRHPEVFTKYSKFITQTWLHIFKNAMLRLAEGGMLIITAYRCFEYLAADRVFKSYGAKQLFLGRNPFSANIELYGGVNARDQFVAIYTKEGPNKILEEDSRVRILCGEKTLEAKSNKVQVSKERVTAQTPDGIPYEVQIKRGGRFVVYRDLKSKQEKHFELDNDELGEAETLATDGTDTFLFVDKGEIYKINWQKAGLDEISVADTADFSHFSRGGAYPPNVYNRGFCIADGRLLGEAEIKEPLAESSFMFHRQLEGESDRHFPITIQTGPSPLSFFEKVRKFFAWLFSRW